MSSRSDEFALNPDQWRTWFRVRRPADGRGGVELAVRIPGYMAETVTRHADRTAAEVAAQAIYNEYAATIKAVKAS